MATSSVPASTVKKRLRNAPMYVNRIQSKGEMVFDYVDWKIYKFKKLKNGIHYKNCFSDLSWYLYLHKDRQNLYVKLVPGDFKKAIECFLVYAPRISIQAQETGRYEYKIPFGTIRDPKNKYYEEDSLRLGFRFLKRSGLTPAVRPFIGARDDKETCALKDEICNSIISAGLQETFVLHYRDGSTVLRKDALAARCKFFYNYFKENPDSTEYWLDTTRETMTRLAGYILCGSVGYSLKLRQVIDCLILGSFLQIPSLQSQCERTLKENINRANVRSIRYAGVISGTDSLVKAADNFIWENLNLYETWATK